MKKVTVIVIVIAVTFLASSCKPNDVNSNLSSVDGAQMSTLEKDRTESTVSAEDTEDTDVNTETILNKTVSPSIEDLDTFLKNEVDTNIKMTFYPSDLHFSEGLNPSETRQYAVGYVLNNQYYTAKVSITNNEGELYISDLIKEINHSEVQSLLDKFSEIYLKESALNLFDFSPFIETVELKRVDFEGIKDSATDGSLSYCFYFESEFKLASNYEPVLAGNIKPIDNQTDAYRQVGFAIMKVENDHYTIESIGTSP